MNIYMTFQGWSHVPSNARLILIWNTFSVSRTMKLYAKAPYGIKDRRWWRHLSGLSGKDDFWPPLFFFTCLLYMGTHTGGKDCKKTQERERIIIKHGDCLAQLQPSRLAVETHVHVKAPAGFSIAHTQRLPRLSVYLSLSLYYRRRPWII